MKKVFQHPLILSLLIIAGFVFFIEQGWLKKPQDVFFRMTGPIQKTFYQYSLKINQFIIFLSSISELEQENNQLKGENDKLLGQLSRLKEVEKENELLREQIGLPNPEPSQLILANVIGQDSSNLGKYILINKGEKHGVKEKAAVIATGNILVGQVIEVTESFSMVRLIIDSNSRINALIQETRMTGLVRGDQGLNLLVGLLPQGEVLETGGTVITSGLAGLLPAGLLIGQIQRVISSDVQIAQQAKIKPAIDFGRLEKVFVIVD